MTFELIDLNRARLTGIPVPRGNLRAGTIA